MAGRQERDLSAVGAPHDAGLVVLPGSEALRLALPEGERIIPLASIRKAKLVLTDELLAAAEAEGRN